MLRNTLSKIISEMSDSDLLESVEWCLSSGNNSPSGRKYLNKVLSHNKPIIDAALNELRVRNEKLSSGIKEMVFGAQ